MPTISLNKERFCKFLGRDITVQEMAKQLPWIGFDIEEVGQDSVKVEFNPNRVDFCSYAGVARAFKGFMGWETGLPKYEVKPGKTVLFIDEAVSGVRPYMLAAVVRNMKLDEDGISDLMEMQEDLHWGVGRDRKKASIGVHNLEVVEQPFTFTAVKPNSVRFVPLDKTDEMSLSEILELHEKGKAYRHLVDWAEKYPLLVDKDGKVLSMPPVINGELTRVSIQTRNLFLDITGTDHKAVEKSLHVLTTALADMGGEIEKVNVKYPDYSIVSPDLTAEKMRLRVAYANELVGLRLSEKQVIECLERCRLGAKKIGEGIIEATVPVYRIDVLHEVDLVEEVAIGYGYHRLKPTFPKSVTIGQEQQAHRLANVVRKIMTGLEFTEVMNFTLTNERWHYETMRRKPKNVIKLANPVSAEYSIARQKLLPGLMKNLMDNKHESFPQRLFEVSDVVHINMRLETRCERLLHMAAVSSHATANFTEIKSYSEAVLANLGLKRWEIKAVQHPSFLEGRAAAVYVRSKRIGLLGEVHPEALNNFELDNPVSAFEINLEEIV
jgi:phenylalanyl-tRNA synthetase beta chain